MFYSDVHSKQYNASWEIITHNAKWDVIIVGSKLEKNKNKLGAQSVVSLHMSVQKDVVEQRPKKKQQDRGSMHKTNVKLKHNFD